VIARHGLLLGALIGGAVLALAVIPQPGHTLIVAPDVPAVAPASPASPPPAVPVVDAIPEPPPVPAAASQRRQIKIGRGDTLLGLMVGAGINRTEAVQALDALRPLFDPRKLAINQQVVLELAPATADGPRHLALLEVHPDPAHIFGVVPAGHGGGFVPRREEKALTLELVAVGLTIHTSLFEAGVAAGVPMPVLLSVIATYSYLIDFQRDFQDGDRLELLYERRVTDAGAVAGIGAVRFARLRLGERDLAVYRFQSRDGRIDGYNRQGESVRKALMRTPIDGARLTSGFGMRNHPILGYSKMHRGVDFAAPTGTPVYAAGFGVLEEADRHGSFGNYVRIRHNPELATAYAHLSRFAPGVHRGQRVEQGQVIAYVGTTGRSTGPHLHYEVLRRGDQVNPMSIDLPVSTKLQGRELEAFRAAMAEADRAFAAGQRPVAVVAGTGPPPGR
jgi:murein DD-endopeptidase MepM/ murein hydrolase activator NlpD